MVHKRKISIVFEENGEQDGQGFTVQMAGHDRDATKLPADQRSPAEFWSLYMMNITVQVLQQAGIVKSMTPQPQPGQVIQ